MLVDDIYWLLADYTLSALSNTALPNVAPNLDDFESNALSVMYGSSSRLIATVTSATATVVPEPCTFVLIGTGIALLVKRRKG